MKGGRTRWLDSLEQRVGRLPAPPAPADRCQTLALTVKHPRSGTAAYVADYRHHARAAAQTAREAAVAAGPGLHVVLRYDPWRRPIILPEPKVPATDERPHLRLVRDAPSDVQPHRPRCPRAASGIAGPCPCHALPLGTSWPIEVYRI